MTRSRQEPLIEDPPGRRARVWCKECKRELTDRDSRLKRLGPECDPDRRTGHGKQHDVDQDTIPGT